MVGKSFSDLKREIIDKDLCTLCGTCVASCPIDVLEYGDDTISIVGNCTSCGICSDVCPGGGIDLTRFEKELFERSRDRQIGHRLGIYIRKEQLTSSKIDFIKAGYFGGRITSVLVAALETGLIDAALLTDWNHSGSLSIGSARIARSREDVISAASSKYVFSPVLSLLKEVERDPDITNAAFVGLPCNIQGFRKMQKDPRTTHLTAKIEYVIGLNCGAPQMENRTWKGMISDLTGIPPDKIKAVRYRKVSSRGLRLEVDRSDGENYTRVMEIARFLGHVAKSPHWTRCRMCPDYSSELSDITFGAPVIRTEKGEKLVENAKDKGYLKSSSFKKSFIQNLQDTLVSFRKRRWARKNIAKRRRNGEKFPEYK